MPAPSPVVVRGEVDRETSPTLQACLLGQRQQPGARALLVDLGAVTFLDARRAEREQTRGVDLGRASGIVRLINTSGGGVLCLAGDVSAEVVADFRRRHGREPHVVDAVDAGSVTGLSPDAVDLVLDHLDAAALRGREIRVRRSPVVERAMAGSTQRG